MLPADQAQILEEAERDAGIDSVRSKVESSKQMPSAEVCVNTSCGEAIPEARRIAYPGVRLCIACKGFSEKYGHLP